jgi:hypothetical protein
VKAESDDSSDYIRHSIVGSTDARGSMWGRHHLYEACSNRLGLGMAYVKVVWTVAA